MRDLVGIEGHERQDAGVREAELGLAPGQLASSRRGQQDEHRKRGVFREFGDEGGGARSLPCDRHVQVGDEFMRQGDDARLAPPGVEALATAEQFEKGVPEATPGVQGVAGRAGRFFAQHDRRFSHRCGDDAMRLAAGAAATAAATRSGFESPRRRRVSIGS